MSLDINLTNVESTTNKKTTLTDNSDTFYPTQKAVKTAVDLKVNANANITGATKTKITYDAKGLVTAGADATTVDITDSSNKRYVTDAQLTVIGNTSGTNTGDQNLSGYVQDSDFSSHSVLAKQSGAGSPVAVTIGTNEILGRLSGGGSNIKGLSTSEVKALLNYIEGSTTITINGTTFDLSANRTFSAVMLHGNPVNSNAGTGGANRFYGFSDQAISTVETSRRLTITNACTLKNFYVRTSGTQPATGSHILTVLKNGIATSIVVTIPAGSGAGIFSDITNSETFAQGDEISILAVNNASTTSSVIISFSIGSI